jgi:hypothetical protein
MFSRKEIFNQNFSFVFKPTQNHVAIFQGRRCPRPTIKVPIIFTAFPYPSKMIQFLMFSNRERVN